MPNTVKRKASDEAGIKRERGKKVTLEHTREKCNQCQAQENIIPVPKRGKRVNQLASAGKIQSTPSAGKHKSDDRKGKQATAINRCQARETGKTVGKRGKTRNQCQAREKKATPLLNAGKCNQCQAREKG